jgi:hypothetical protein
MKHLLFLLSFVASVTPIWASQMTVREALRVVGREKGEPWMFLLLEARGVQGDPQPAHWTLAFKDAQARAGVREFVVEAASGKVTEERTPLEPGTLRQSPVMSAKSIAFDSGEVFQKTNGEAQKQKLGFSSLTYQLRQRGERPLWRVQLFDAGGLEVGRLEISGQDGTLVSPLRQPVRSGADSPASAQKAQDKALPERWVEGGGLFGHMQRWGETGWEATKETSGRVGDSVSKFFTGRPLRPEGSN